METNEQKEEQEEVGITLRGHTVKVGDKWVTRAGETATITGITCSSSWPIGYTIDSRGHEACSYTCTREGIESFTRYQHKFTDLIAPLGCTGEFRKTDSNPVSGLVGNSFSTTETSSTTTTASEYLEDGSLSWEVLFAGVIGRGPQDPLENEFKITI